MRDFAREVITLTHSDILTHGDLLEYIWMIVVII